jgi:hypothetical protein
MFCFMASRDDLATAARLQPAVYARYVATEKRLDHSFAMPRNGRRVFLEELTGVAAEPDLTIPDFLRRRA